MNEEFLDRLKSGWTGDCPHCGRYAQMYHRQVDSTMTRKLIEAYNLFGQNPFTTRDITFDRSPANGVTNFKYWQILKEVPITVKDGKKTKEVLGWKITDLGVSFLLNQHEIPKVLAIYNDTIYGWVKSKGFMTIQDCLGKKFNYDELMNNSGLEDV